MNRKLLLTAIILTLIVAALPICAAESEGETSSSNYFVEGTVVKGNSTGNTPMSGVTVTIIENNTIRNSVVTDEDGLFSIGIKSNKDLQISFTAPEFTIRACPHTTTQSGTDVLILNLTADVPYNPATKTYTITSGADGMQCAIMMASIGELKGVVTYAGGVISNASVMLAAINDSTSTYKTHTDSKGQFSIICPVGTYYVMISCDGFVSSGTMTATVSSNSSSLSVTLLKEDVNKYLGLDIAHVMMLMAVLIGILLVTAAWILSRQMRNKSTDTDIIDDSPDDEDIRYP